MEAAAAPPRRKKKVEEIPHRRSLVGSIVEKGLSSSTSSDPPRPPQASVLPFPVARHRSQGPHWVPTAGGVEDDVEDDRDGTDFSSCALLAKPPKRKERKNLDFSRWREFVGGGSQKEVKLDAGNVNSEIKRVSGSTTSDIRALDGERKEKFEVGRHSEVLDSSLVVAHVNGSGEVDELGVTSMEEKGEIELSKDDILGSSFVASAVTGNGRNGVVEVAAPSLADAIDMENRARLGQMSEDEIAEAQSEIMERISPAFLEMLKKRGQDKMEGKLTGVTSSKDNVRKEFKIKGAEAANGALTCPKQTDGPKAAGESVHGVSELQPSVNHNDNKWKAWSERVEKVRGLRFSLDGDLIASSSPEQQNEFNVYNPDNVTERDYLRTEGDPGAAGYTIKEAVGLVRSMVPAQRSFALRLLASVCDKALSNFQEQTLRCSSAVMGLEVGLVDWQAVWAYALGPEPELALALRIALDDNNNSVVLACTKVIQCLLCCDLNEKIFDISEKSSIHENATFTAPVFRSRPEIGCGFLHGGFWKYNTKPSNILPTHDDGEEDEGTRTISDDVVVAGQDLAAGLVRMGILPRICYLLETDPSPPLDECLLSILIGLARHSPTCSNAVMTCPRLVQTVVDRFTKLTSLENLPYQTKSVMLLKVLSEADKRNCVDFITRGIFQRTMWQLYKNALSLHDSLHSGKEQCKLTSALMVQQIRFWKVCIRYGYCISYFSDFFPAMCFWLSPPTFGTLIENNIVSEFTSVTTEAFLVLEALSRRLPIVHSVERSDKSESSDVGKEAWSWSHVVPMVELAMKWLLLQNISNITSVSSWKRSDIANEDNIPGFHLLWVISAVMHMLTSIIDRIAPEEVTDMHYCGTLPWLPDFVPKIGLAIVKSGFLNLADSNGRHIKGLSNVDLSLVEWLCQLRHHNNSEVALASTCCLHRLAKLIVSVDKSIQRARSSCHQPVERYNSSLEDSILSEGISKCGQGDLSHAIDMFVSLTSSRWQIVQSIETYGRGGPAPGVGLGWGSFGGGFWSVTFIQSQIDVYLLGSLYKIFPLVSDKHIAAAAPSMPNWSVDQTFPILLKINSVIGMSLVAGPCDRSVMGKTLKILFQNPVLRFLAVSIDHFLQSNERFRPLKLQFSDEDYLIFSNALDAHYRSRWLTAKLKSSHKADGRNPDEQFSPRNGKLETIHEDDEMMETSDVCQEEKTLLTEWANQRLPLPMHWPLSPLCTVSDPEAAQALHGSSNVKNKYAHLSGHPTDVVKGGLFFLLGLEATSHFLFRKSIYSSILGVPLVWKLHALSMMLVIKLDVLDDVRFRDIFETLQMLYGWHLRETDLDDVKLEGKSLPPAHQSLDACGNHKRDLDFQKQIHESYGTFIETLVEHFASISYGDAAFGRQVAVYLHRSVDVAVRLATWNAVSNAHILELLPPLGNCISEASGYLDPAEDSELILEAYVKSWTSGALDRAATRGSMSFTLAVHHLSCFIFHKKAQDRFLLRNRLVKRLLRGLSRKPNQQGMMLALVKYGEQMVNDHNPKAEILTSEGELARRFMILHEACEGSSPLLAELEKLKSSVTV